jgi:hypothetical protein
VASFVWLLTREHRRSFATNFFCGQVSLTCAIDIFSTRVATNVASCLQNVKRKSRSAHQHRARFSSSRAPSVIVARRAREIAAHALQDE